MKIDFIFELAFLSLGAASLTGVLIASFFCSRAGGWCDKEKDEAILLFQVSGVITLIFGARLLYLLAGKAGYIL